MNEMRLSAAVLLVVALLSGACSSSDEGKSPAPDGVGMELASDAAEAPGDLSSTDLPEEVSADVPGVDLTDGVSGEDVEPVDLEPEDLGPPPPVAEPVDPVPVEPPVWLVTYAKGSEDDKVGEALDMGLFVMPDGPGYDANGVEWLEREAGDKGKMGFAGYGIFYAAVSVDLEAGENLIVRADKFYQVYVNGDAQPGDPYTSRKHRTPGAGKEGANYVIAMAYSAINDPEIELFKTTAELHFNLLDLTSAHPRPGDTSARWLGVPVLNLTDHPVRKVTARVLESDFHHATEIDYPSFSPASVTQVAFALEPRKAPEAADEIIPVTVRIESNYLEWSYEQVIELTSVGEDAAYKRTRRSAVDNSVQYYGVRPATAPAPTEGHAMLLSLHGAGVQAIGQANSYGGKEWIVQVAATNRRPFGFDWEEWGRLDGVETLDDAMEHFGSDPTRVFVSGHSMGGHGTWQFGVHLPGRFAVVGPSAGWSSFYSYGGSTPPTGAFARARASSFTLNYVSNLAHRAVYVIHGDADDNVPISEAYLMQEAVEPVAEEFYFHIQPGAGHWWDGDAAPGADCVDWPPLFELMQETTLDPFELDFEYTTPSPWINATHSYVTLRSQLDPYEDSRIESVPDGPEVELTTYNLRSMVLDGAALGEKGVTKLVVDGQAVALADSDIEWGPQGGKNEAVQGPFNQVFHRPFCFVYPSSGSESYQRYASYLISTWNIIGNGHGCALPLDKLTQAIRTEYNIVYVGIERAKVPVPEGITFDWNATNIVIDGKEIPDAALLFVFPEKGHLSAALVTTEGAEHMLFWHQPFSSRAGLPDYVGWTYGGAYAAGFFDADWNYDPALGSGP